MKSLKSLTLIIIFSLLFTLQFLSLYSNSLPPQIRGLLYEEKTRLGSTPPSCHNKCNICHPCMAVQVPTVPGQHRVKPGQRRVNPEDYYDQPPGGNRYSNYKPLGWKCRCGGRLYNP